jgi:hypothetical protein
VSFAVVFRGFFDRVPAALARRIAWVEMAGPRDVARAWLPALIVVPLATLIALHCRNDHSGHGAQPAG